MSSLVFIICPLLAAGLQQHRTFNYWMRKYTLSIYLSIHSTYSKAQLMNYGWSLHWCPRSPLYSPPSLLVGPLLLPSIIFVKAALIAHATPSIKAGCPFVWAHNLVVNIFHMFFNVVFNLKTFVTEIADT